MWIAVAVTLLFLEYFCVGLAVLSKATGDKRWYLALVPVYGLSYLNKLGGVFTVLSVPVKKCFPLFAELLLVSLLCGLYWTWGVNTLIERAYTMLGQIMILPIVVCYAIMYFSLVRGSQRIYKRFGGKHSVAAGLSFLLLLPIPAVLISLRGNEPMSLADMFV